MGKFTMATQGGESPRDYIARRTYAGFLDLSDARECKRITRLAIKEVSDFKDSVDAQENKKTGRLEADDSNNTGARGLLWCDAILSALNPLGELSIELMKSNKLAALINVPELAQ